MMKVKPLTPTEPFAPRWAAVGAVGEAVIMKFERRENAVEFVDWHNKHEGGN